MKQNSFVPITLPFLEDERGSLLFAQIDEQIPFKVKGATLYTFDKGQLKSFLSERSLILNLYGELEITLIDDVKNTLQIKESKQAIYVRSNSAFQIKCKSEKLIFLHLKSK